jgi:hypothetical protein
VRLHNRTAGDGGKELLCQATDRGGELLLCPQKSGQIVLPEFRGPTLFMPLRRDVPMWAEEFADYPCGAGGATQF